MLLLLLLLLPLPVLLLLLSPLLPLVLSVWLARKNNQFLNGWIFGDVKNHPMDCMDSWSNWCGSWWVRISAGLVGRRWASKITKRMMLDKECWAKRFGVLMFGARFRRGEEAGIPCCLTAFFLGDDPAVTFWFPNWRSLNNLWKGHISTIPKRSLESPGGWIIIIIIIMIMIMMMMMMMMTMLFIIIKMMTMMMTMTMTITMMMMMMMMTMMMMMMTMMQWWRWWWWWWWWWLRWWWWWWRQGWWWWWWWWCGCAGWRLTKERLVALVKVVFWRPYRP